MVRIALIRPGSTAFDDEGRIKGCLDFPLSGFGEKQAREVAHKLAIHLKESVGSSTIDCGLLRTLSIGPSHGGDYRRRLLDQDAGGRLYVERQSRVVARKTDRRGETTSTQSLSTDSRMPRRFFTAGW